MMFINQIDKGSQSKCCSPGMAMFVALVLFSAAPLTANSAPIMIDFGGSSAGSGAVGPAHADGTIPNSFTTWDFIREDSTGEDLQPINPILHLGRETNDTSEIITWDFAPNRLSVAYTPTPGSVFDNDVLGDTLRHTNNESAMGIRIEVVPGLYAVYVTARSDDVNKNDMTIWVGADDGFDGTTDFSGFSSSQLPNLTDNAFTLHDNYARQVVSVSAGQQLIVVSNPNSPLGEAVFSSIQVAPVPVPAALPLFGTALGLMGLPAWRRWRAATVAAL